MVLAASLAIVVLGDSRTPLTTLTESNASNREHTLSVVGSAQTTFAPDTVVMTFIIEEKGATPSEALSKLTAASNNVVSAILRLGISADDVKTTGINIYPEYVYREKEPPLIVGYIASYSLEVRTKKIAEASGLIEQAVNAGADYISGLYFTASPEQLSTVYKQLLSAAVADAEAKAEALLTPLGLRKTGVVSVSIVDSPPAMAARAAPEAGAGPPILTGTTSYTVSVSIVYAIAPR